MNDVLVNFTENRIEVSTLFGTTGGGSGATTFLELSDVPSSYSGQSLQGVRVNSGETGLEFYTTSAGGVSTASNGLTLVGSDVRLGGTLTANTNIVGAAKAFTIGGTTSLSGFGVYSSVNSQVRVDNGSGIQANLDSDTGGITIGYTTNSFSTSSQIQIGSAVMTITDSMNNHGMQYTADYSTLGIADYGNRWIPDYGAVLSLTGTTGAWKLDSGGTLTGNNSISGGSGPYSVTIGAGTRVSSFIVNASTAITLNTQSALTIAYTGLTHTIVVASTGFTYHGSHLFESSTLKIGNPAATFSYLFTGAAIAANRTITLPLLAGNDTLVTEAFTQTLTNKTLGTGTKVLLGSDATGDIYYNGGSGTLTRLAAGTSTFVLTSNGAGVAPSWQAAGGGGSWLLASGGTITGNNTVNFGATGTTPYTLTLVSDNLAATRTNGRGIWLQNTTAAINGTQQNSPSLSWEGRGFGTVGSVNQAVAFTSYVLPVQGSTNPTAYWILAQSINAGADINLIDITKLGNEVGINFTGSPTGNRAGLFVDLSGGAVMLGSKGGSYFPTFIVNSSEVGRFNSGGNFLIGSTTVGARLYVNQAALSSAWIPSFRIDNGADTAKTTATEFPDAVFGGLAGDIPTAASTRTNTWLAGTVATQRSNYFRGTVLTGASAIANFTNAYTVYLDAPTFGANAAGTPWALGVNGNINLIGSTLTHSGGSTFIFGSGSQSVFMYAGGTQRLSMNSNGTWSFINGPSSTSTAWITFNETSRASGVNTGINYIGATHTTLTASTESTDLNWNLARNVQFATGAITTQRAVYYRGPTYAFVGGSTITNAYTVYIDPPVQGTNATLTNTWALGLAGNLTVTGKTQTTSDVTVTDATKGFVLKDTQGTPHYWRITVSIAGALVITDIGTTPP